MIKVIKGHEAAVDFDFGERESQGFVYEKKMNREGNEANDDK